MSVILPRKSKQMSQAHHAKVLHRGRVVKISGDTVYVEINPDESDCVGCTLCGSCNSRSRQLVQVPVRDACAIPQMNQEVTVAANAGPQNAATLLMTFPLVAFVAATVVLSIVGIDHSLAVLGGCLASAAALCAVHFANRRADIWTLEPEQEAGRQ